LQQAEKIAVSEIAQRLGLKSLRSNSWGPCPNCNAVERGSNDKRGTIGLNTDNVGWACHRCKVKGSGIDLVSFHLGGSKFKQLDQLNKKKVQVWFQGEISDGANISEKPQKLRGSRPPLAEVQSLWNSSFKLHQLSRDHQAISFLKSRNLNLEALAKSGVARITPEQSNYTWPTWWPAGRSRLWRVIVPAFNQFGQFSSLHGRAIDLPKAGPKTLWPKGFEAKGLFMPNRFAVKMMRTEDVDIDGVLFVEGITDFMKCSAEVEDLGLKIAILGGTSGSFGIVSELKIPKETKIYIGTDPDQQGREYANRIQLQLADRISYRIPLEDLVGDSDA
tara:strand:+ start:451 stop:1449 length:999 start_codon:yes stop_codon:yes gene_type:complete